MKNHPKIVLLFLLFLTSLTQAQVDLRVGLIGGVNRYICEEEISFRFTVFNLESAPVSDYDIIILDDGIEVYKETVSEVLAGDGSKEYIVDLIPSTYLNHSYRIEVFHADDINTVNNYYNFFNQTAYMYGGEFEVKITGENRGATSFYMATEHEDQFDVYRSGSINPDGSQSYFFCFPWDSCGNLEIRNPFSYGWCELLPDSWKYDFIMDAKSDYVVGDTVIVLGPEGYAFYTLLEPKTDDDLFAVFGPEPFLNPIYCESLAPSDAEKRSIEITNTITGEILGVLPEIPFQDVYSLDFCMFDDDVSINKVRKREELNIYPNPSSNFVNFGQELEVISVYDFTGKMVFEIQNSSTMDISNLNAGMYIIQSQNENLIYSGSFIKK